MIKTIIFDFDGVLFDSYQFFFAILHADNPKLTQKQFRDRFNGNYYQHTGNGRPVIPRNFFEEYQRLGENLTILASTKNALKRLSSRYHLVIVSSNLNSLIEHILSKNDALFFIQRIYGAEVEKSKTKKLQMIMKDFDVLPVECIFITDTLGDILEAHEVSIRSLAYTGKEAYHSKNRLKKGNPVGYIKSLSEVERCFVNE